MPATPGSFTEPDGQAWGNAYNRRFSLADDGPLTLADFGAQVRSPDGRSRSQQEDEACHATWVAMDLTSTCRTPAGRHHDWADKPGSAAFIVGVSMMGLCWSSA